MASDKFLHMVAECRKHDLDATTIMCRYGVSRGQAVRVRAMAAGNGALSRPDYSSLDGATALAGKIVAYWRARGIAVSVEVYKAVCGTDEDGAYYGIRSDIATRAGLVGW